MKMLSLSEAIRYYKDLASRSDKHGVNYWYWRQLVKWLEELRARRWKDGTND